MLTRLDLNNFRKAFELKNDSAVLEIMSLYILQKSSFKEQQINVLF